MKKLMAIVLIFAFSLILTGCGKKTSAVEQNIKTLAEGFQQTMITYFEIKNLQDNALLLGQVSDNLKKVENSKKKLEQLTGVNETVTDAKLKAEISNFIDLGREREKLAIKYLDDIRRDLDYKSKNPDTQVNINNYIVNIPNNLLDLEYRSEQATKRLNQLITKK